MTYHMVVMPPTDVPNPHPPVTMDAPVPGPLFSKLADWQFDHVATLGRSSLFAQGESTATVWCDEVAP